MKIYEETKIFDNLKDLEEWLYSEKYEIRLSLVMLIREDVNMNIHGTFTNQHASVRGLTMDFLTTLNETYIFEKIQVRLYGDQERDMYIDLL